jgi:hypothetical protein
MTFSIVALSITQHNTLQIATHHNDSHHNDIHQNDSIVTLIMMTLSITAMGIRHRDRSKPRERTLKKIM